MGDSIVKAMQEYAGEHTSPMMDAITKGMIDICKPFHVRYTVEVHQPTLWALKLVLMNQITGAKGTFTYHRDEFTDFPSSQLAYPILRRYKQAHEAAYIQPESNIDLGYN